MEVRTVSAKDARASLSRKSPLPKKSLRKAMLSPYETIRPICSDTTEIEEIMQRFLVHAKRGNKWIPWSEFKEMSEEERKQAKDERKVKNDNKSIRNQLVYGINEVFSAIEKHNLSSAVVCEDLAPAFLLNFILDLATIHHVPILIIPNLRKVTRETLGFSCSCLGIKRNAARENSFFYPLHQKIVEIVKEFEVPEHKILCQCPLKESAEFLGKSASFDGHQELKLGDKDAENVLKTNSGWPCMNPSRKSFWKQKKEKLRKGEGDEQTGNESGMAYSSLIGNELMEEAEGKEESKTLPATSSKSKASSEGHRWKKPEAHPYLRTFLLTLRPRKAKKRKNSCAPSESVILCKNEKYTKKRKQNTDGDGEVSEVRSAKAQSTTINKSKGFKYLIRSGRERKHIFDQYKPLKMADN